MDLAVVDRFFAVGSLLAGAAGIALVVWATIDRAALGRSLGMLLLPGATLMAAAATGGSLFYSEYFGRLPCVLCWYQRIFMYSAAVIGIVAIIRKLDKAVLPYMGWLATVGGLISVYHILDQNTDWIESGACNIDIPCSSKYVDLFGFVSIPVMALGCFIFIAAASFIGAALAGDNE